MRSTTWIYGLLSVLTLCLPLAAVAAGQDIQEQTSQTGIAYVTGGVGKAEQAAMKQRFGAYRFNLVNVDKRQGGYVADVAVRIRNQAGEQLLQVTTGGPWLFADLPQGSYDLTAKFQGQTHTRSFTVSGAQPQRVVLRWRTPVDDSANRQPSGDTSLRETVQVEQDASVDNGQEHRSPANRSNGAASGQ